MPVYTYRCDQHGDVDTYATEPLVTLECPACGTPSRRIFNSGLVIIRPERYRYRPDQPGYGDLSDEVRKHRWQS